MKKVNGVFIGNNLYDPCSKYGIPANRNNLDRDLAEKLENKNKRIRKMEQSLFELITMTGHHEENTHQIIEILRKYNLGELKITPEGFKEVELT
ncbi:hypothetical protein [Enterococcus sp. 5H]|uniref:hypothetical protein n=1 Tax=Enterococcus sp. 5H TaxID=1229490 RepID=UPI0023022B78|nr:hypothetical protein [Enterococcus sp. 5H]MDA9472087.1 hypothetical protein [Enterococcus sp. 5H]